MKIRVAKKIFNKNFRGIREGTRIAAVERLGVPRYRYLGWRKLIRSMFDSLFNESEKEDPSNSVREG